jgi:hypothetical protein
MIDEETRRRYVRCFRSLSTEDAAMQLAVEFERELRARAEPWPSELTDLEQLPDWSRSRLLQWALSHPLPRGLDEGRYDVSGLQVLREFRLIGDLARAAEQALDQGEQRQAHRITEALARVWVRLRGEQLLAECFADIEAEQKADA